MRDFCKVSPTLWRSQKFNKLSDTDKLLYFYFLTNPHTNAVGCYYLPIQYACIDLGVDEDTLKKGIERVSESGLIEYDHLEQIILIHNWLTFNEPMNPKHGQKIISDITKIPSSHFKRLVALSFNYISQSKGWSVTAPVENVGKGIERVSTQDKTRQDGDNTETLVLPDWLPANLWSEFLAMRKAIKKPPTDKAIALLIRDLDKLRSDGHSPTDVLEQSIKNNWQGVFSIKSSANSAGKAISTPRRQYDPSEYEDMS